MNALLRANVTSVQKQVYPPGIRFVTARTPRVHITTFTPSENIASLGASIQSFNHLRMDLEVYGKTPAEVERCSDEVIQTIKTNRNYVPSITVPSDDGYGQLNGTTNSNGYFLMLRISGGSDTMLQPDSQLYRRTISLAGDWFQSA